MAIRDAADKLRVLIPRLASDSDGEVVATVRAIQRTLKKHECDLHDLAALAAGGSGGGQKSNANGNGSERRQQRRKTTSDMPEDHDDWMEVATFCCDRAGSLRSREAEFVEGMIDNLQQWGTPTEKQGRWLWDIYCRLGGAYR